jgi:hypothetical protein
MRLADQVGYDYVDTQGPVRYWWGGLFREDHFGGKPTHTTNSTTSKTKQKGLLKKMFCNIFSWARFAFLGLPLHLFMF